MKYNNINADLVGWIIVSIYIYIYRYYNYFNFYFWHNKM